MNITVTFRHVDASDAIKKRATDKIAKLQKFLRQPMTARVTVSLEKLMHQVEARISSGGERYEAHEVTEDMYTSIDKVIDKLERQIRGTKGAAEKRKRHSGATLRRGASVAPVPEDGEGPEADEEAPPPPAPKKTPAKRAKAPAKKKGTTKRAG